MQSCSLPAMAMSRYRCLHPCHRLLAPGHGHVTLPRCAVAFAIATDAVGHRDAPIAVAQQQSSTTSEPIHYEVHIHNARGDHIKTTIDGEVVEEPDMKLIESDRSDGPDA
jgi:hypothetical protein